MTHASDPVGYLKKEAKKLLRLVKAKDTDALTRLKFVLANSDAVTLMRAQHVIAVEHGFTKWNALAQASAIELQQAIALRRNPVRSLEAAPTAGTPLGNFLRGPGIIPPTPRHAVLAEMFDKMTMEEQRRYLDEDARAMGLFRRS